MIATANRHCAHSRVRLFGQGPGDAQLVRVPRAIWLVPGRRDRVQQQLATAPTTSSISFLSTSSDQQRVSLVRRLAANDSSIDILAMDVDWTAEFATAKWLKPVPAFLAAQIKSVDLPGPVQTATLAEQTVGDPDQLEHRAALVPQGSGPVDRAHDLDADDQRGRPTREGRGSRITSKSRARNTRG